MGKAKPIPDGYHTMTPNMVVRDAPGAMEFYKKAFGAEEVMRNYLPDGKTVINGQMRIGNSMFMLCEELPQMRGCVSPAQLGGTTMGLFLFVEDVDAAFARAKAAGVQVVMEPADMFWGDRYCKVIDPYGHWWEIATHKEDLTAEEIAARSQAFFAQLGKQGK